MVGLPIPWWLYLVLVLFAAALLVIPWLIQGFRRQREPLESKQAPEARRTMLYRKLGVPIGWLEGTTLAERRQFRIRSVDLAKAWRVRLVPNRIGGVYLEAEDREGHIAGCHLLVLGLNSSRHLSAAALDQICLGLAASSAPSAPAVCERLLEQARYLRTGQALPGSPLRTHSEWIPGGLGIPDQEVPLPNSSDPFETVRRDDPRAPKDGTY